MRGGATDALADPPSMGEPFWVFMLVDNWSRQSPVLDAGSRIPGETVCQALDGVLLPDAWISRTDFGRF